jgi:hypothetical protein
MRPESDDQGGKVNREIDIIATSTAPASLGPYSQATRAGGSSSAHAKAVLIQRLGDWLKVESKSKRARCFEIFRRSCKRMVVIWIV